MFRYSSYSPYEPYTTYYAEYTSTTTVPTYTLQYNLLSLADQQSRLYTQRQQLAAQEREIQQQRTAILRRIRAQRLREAIEEAEIEDIVETVLEKDRDGDRLMRAAVMYTPQANDSADCNRGILEEARTRKLEQGLPADREIYRELKVKEMLDPSPRPPKFVPERKSQTSHIPPKPRAQPEITVPETQETPIVNELPRTSPFRPFAQQYIPEPQPAVNKRGSRRASVRRDSHAVPDREHIFPTVTGTLQSYTVLRAKLQSELSSIPLSIRSDVPPTMDQRKILHVHISKLEDLLDEVDAVPLPIDADELVTTRKARREIVADIVAAIDGIERYIQPSTPTDVFGDGSVRETTSDAETSDSEENALIDFEIQRVIRETLARKRDEESSRRSVTVEDVPDAEY